MSAREFALWMAFYIKEPPDKADNFRMGQVCASIYNASGHLRRGTTAKAADFMPKQKPRDLTPEQSINVLEAMFGGKK